MDRREKSWHLRSTVWLTSATVLPSSWAHLQMWTRRCMWPHKQAEQYLEEKSRESRAAGDAAGHGMCCCGEDRKDVRHKCMRNGSQLVLQRKPLPLLLCGYTQHGLSVHRQRSRASWWELNVTECHLMGRSSWAFGQNSTGKGLAYSSSLQWTLRRRGEDVGSGTDLLFWQSVHVPWAVNLIMAWAI